MRMHIDLLTPKAFSMSKNVSFADEGTTTNVSSQSEVAEILHASPIHVGSSLS